MFVGAAEVEGVSPVVVDGAPLHEEVVPEGADVGFGEGAVSEVLLEEGEEEVVEVSE